MDFQYYARVPPGNSPIWVPVIQDGCKGSITHASFCQRYYRPDSFKCMYNESERYISIRLKYKYAPYLRETLQGNDWMDTPHIHCNRLPLRTWLMQMSSSVHSWRVVNTPRIATPFQYTFAPQEDIVKFTYRLSHPPAVSHQLVLPSPSTWWIVCRPGSSLRLPWM